MLKSFLKGNITLKKSVVNWQEAIKIAAQKLLEKGNIDERYINKMIENINKLGPYIVLTDDVAMPHSRPEDGVNKTGISLLKLDKGVSFGKGTDIRLVFILAAQDSDSHIELIAELIETLQNDKKLLNILQSRSEQEIIDNLE